MKNVTNNESQSNIFSTFSRYFDCLLFIVYAYCKKSMSRKHKTVNLQKAIFSLLKCFV